MEPRALFEQLCGVANTLETFIESVKERAMRDALESILTRLDHVIDDLVLTVQEETGCV